MDRSSDETSPHRRQLRLGLNSGKRKDGWNHVVPHPDLNVRKLLIYAMNRTALVHAINTGGLHHRHWWAGSSHTTCSKVSSSGWPR